MIAKLEQFPIGLNQRRHCEEPQRGDEAIPNSGHRPLYCFAEIVIGPATSGNSAFTRVNARLPVGSQ